MGIISNLFESRNLNSAQLVELLTAGMSSASGVRVTEEGSLRSTPVLACVRIISESIASLPLVLYRRQGRSKRRATEHVLYGVLHDMANPEMTAFEWREFMFSKVLLWGNAYSEIEYAPDGSVRALWPLLSDKMEGISRNGNGDRTYKYRLPGGQIQEFPGWKIHHVKGLGYDGIQGYSPVRMAMQAIGLGLATEEFGARFFSNGARMSGALKHPGQLSEGAYGRLQASFAAEHQGLSNAHRMKILEEGMEWQPMTIPPEEAQFLETRRFQVSEIARIFRVPPHMLADLERATFSNIEHQSLEFVMHTLRPWLVRHEQAIYRDLLAEDERELYQTKYVVEGLLRGDTSSRYEAYSTAINNGWMSRNEVRELEDLNPAPDLDEYLIPLNMLEIGQDVVALPEPRYQHDGLVVRDEVEEAPALEVRQEQVRDNRQLLMRRNVRLFEDAAGRLVRRETADIRRALPRFLRESDTEGLISWIIQFYDQLRSVIPGYFLALMLTYAESILDNVGAELEQPPTELTPELEGWVNGYLENFAASYAVGGSKQLQALIRDEEDIEAAILERLAGWEETKAQKTALEQAFEAGNALVLFGFAKGGVEFLRWSARGDSCPLCNKLDGTRIPISGSFVEEGDTVSADGVSPLPVRRTMRHGPLHAGCDCVVIQG